MPNELKPCPFCGNIPIIKKNEGKLMWLVCPEDSICYGSRLIIAFGEEHRDQAITAWNTRPNQEDLAEAVSLLGMLFDEIFCMEAEGVEFMPAADRLKAINKTAHAVYERFKSKRQGGS